MANNAGYSGRRALAAAIGMVTLLAACDFHPGKQVWERTTWAGTTSLPAQAVKGGAVVYLKVDLGDFLSSSTRQIELPLPDGESLLIEKTGEASRDNRQLVWKGKIKGDEDSVATFATSNGFLAGNVFTSSGRMYRVDQVASGIQVLYEVNRSLFPVETQPLNAPQPVGLPSGSEQSGVPCAEDNAENIQVMVVYTAAACAGSVVNGASNGCTADADLNIRNDILAIKEETNTAFAESQATPRISLAFVGPVGDYTETNDLQDELARLLLVGEDEAHRLGSPVAFLDDVQQWRDQHGADIVSFVTKPIGAIADGPSCGVATLMADNKSWFEKYAYMVVPVDCMNLNQSFTHELGHLMGAGHEVPTPNQTTVFTDNRAFVKLNPTMQGTPPWRTVMAENSTACTTRRADLGCDRILRFSNPSADYNGDSTGTATQNNSNVVSTTADTVSKFRQSPSCGNP